MASKFVLSRAAATLERFGSHARHSMRLSRLRRSPLTETPFTAFLVHIPDRPSRLTPHPSFTGLAIRSRSLRRLREFRLDGINFSIDFGYLLLVPRLPVKVVDPDCNRALAR